MLAALVGDITKANEPIRLRRASFGINRLGALSEEEHLFTYLSEALLWLLIWEKGNYGCCWEVALH